MGFISLVDGTVLQIQAHEIPEKGRSVAIDDMTWFPEQEISRKGAVSATLSLSRTGERVFLTGSIDFVLLASCDKCLVEFELPQHLDFRVILDLGCEDPALVVKDYEWDLDELDVVYLVEPTIDLGDILAQQVILALPQKRVCRDECRGLCPRCGEDLNTDSCRCVDGDDESPFRLLGRLTIKNS